MNIQFWSENGYKSVDSYQALRFMQASQQFLASIRSIYLFETQIFGLCLHFGSCLVENSRLRK